MARNLNLNPPAQIGSASVNPLPHAPPPLGSSSSMTPMLDLSLKRDPTKQELKASPFSAEALLSRPSPKPQVRLLASTCRVLSILRLIFSTSRVVVAELAARLSQDSSNGGAHGGGHRKEQPVLEVRLPGPQIQGRECCAVQNVYNEVQKRCQSCPCLAPVHTVL